MDERTSLPEHRRVLIALVALGLTTFVQLYYPQALIPALSRDFAVDASQAALTISGATVGLAVAALAWSWVADRIGRARAMRIAIVSAALIGLLLPFVTSFPLIVGLRVAQGVALGGTPALALAYLNEQVGRRAALTAGATYISGTVVGGLAGRLIAAPIADLADWRVAALVAGALSALGAAVTVIALPRERRAAGAEQPRHGMWQGMLVNLADPRQFALYAQGFLLMGAQVAVFNYLGYRLEMEPFGLPPALTAVIFLAGLSGAVSARLAATFAARFGRRRVLLASSLTMVLGAALTVPERLTSVLVGLLLFTTAYFSAHSIASGWVGPMATSGVTQATSLYTLFYYAGSSLFGWLGGLAFAAGWAGTAAMVIAIVLIAFTIARALLPDPAEEVRTQPPTRPYAAPR
ncbi:putative MFS family arabinose efflux permease [Nocardioides luteus]|uniref:MFS transporter n=1 Tax=Nocardioides luteus TaxID=1844 RepID=UPI001E55D91A|nr:MFS transporter [Nocardioides luteus]MDR7311399.1 putative MFS family arabinose efflux permease [Nocardioides luteus]